MLPLIIVFIILFFIGFSIGIICFFKKKFVDEHYHIIIPMLCIAFWAIYFLVTIGFEYDFIGDFGTYYMAGKQVLINPARLYYTPATPYVYLPSFAISFSVSLSLLPLKAAYYSFFMINYLSGILSVIEFDRILKMMNVRKKKIKFFFLLVISNGYIIYSQFKFCSFKYIVFIILLFIIRREMQFRMEEKIRDLKFYLVNYGLFIYAIGVTPYFIFPLLIYVFQDVKLKEMFNKEYIQRYILVSALFILENFLFVIYPHLIFDFLKSIEHPTIGRALIRMFYLKDLVVVTSSQMRVIIYVFNTILAIITIILIRNKTLKIEEKFSYYFLAHLFFGVYSFQFLLCVILFPFIILLFVPFLKQNVSGKEFIKSNKMMLIGVLSIAIIYFVADDFIFIELFPSYSEIVGGIIWNSKLLVLHIIMMICLVTLHIQKYNVNKIQKDLSFRIINTREII